MSSPIQPLGPEMLTSARSGSDLESLGAISLSNNQRMSEREMRDVANQFETMLYRLVLKEMRKTVPKDGVIGQSHATKMYQDIIDDHLAEQIATTNNLGLEEAIVKDLKQKQESIMGPKQSQQDGPIELPEREQEAGGKFFPLNEPSTEAFLSLQEDKQPIPLPKDNQGPIPLGNRTRVSTSQIDNGR